MRFYTKRRRIPVINVVSLIDVFCLLLIFFIVTTTFKKTEPKIQIKVPESTSAEKDTQAQEPVIIYATKAQEIYIGEEKIPLARLGGELKARKDRAKNVKVLDASKEAGINNMSMFTEEPKRDGTAAPAQ